MSGPESSFVQHWLSLAETLGVAAQTSHLLLDDLVERHTEPHRHYHTGDHIVAVISRLASLDALTPTTLLSAYFHDAIYDATRADNEARSAELAVAVLGPLEISEVDDVAAIIRATAGHQLPDDAPTETAVFLDADLAILAAPTTVYDAYARAIRAEYAHMNDADFRSGRTAVLTHFAERETLYFTDPGKARFEAAARKNLARELASLAR
jgi:predicted metal-dependent HD superfamily phosphohydrolase